MSTRLNRRDFLKMLAAGAGGLALQHFLSACGIRPRPSPSPTATIEARSETQAVETVLPTATPAARPDLVIVRGGEPEEMIRRAMAAFGGMQTFVPAGARVVIKPNICSASLPEYAATTNPWLVGALVRLCLEAGAGEVTVMDLPIRGSGEAAYATSGIRAQVEAAGGRMEVMNALGFQSVAIPEGRRLRAANVYQPALQADVLINVPIAKDHSTTRLTLGMKNLMGLVPDRDRGLMHRTDIHQTIADLASLIRPQLTVVDAIRILTAGGPVNHDLSAVEKRDTILVSPDMVAADSWATSLFGLTPDDIDYIRLAADMGLGRKDWQALRIEEIVL